MKDVIPQATQAEREAVNPIVEKLGTDPYSRLGFAVTTLHSIAQAADTVTDPKVLGLAAVSAVRLIQTLTVKHGDLTQTLDGILRAEESVEAGRKALADIGALPAPGTAAAEA